MYFLRRKLNIQISNHCVKNCSTPRLFSLNPKWFATIHNRNDHISKFDVKLPRLPIPTLEDTLTKYLKTTKPFLSNDEYIHTEKLAEDLKKNGKKLQEYLLQKASKEENWMSQWWLNNAYLEFRKPVVAWSSPGLVFPTQTFKSEADQLTYAANMIASAVRYKDDIDNCNIKQEMSGKDPLDMSQYSKIFGTCRIPKPKRDSIIYNDPLKPSKHIVIAHNNNFFKMSVYYEDGNILEIEDIYDNLLAIVENSLDKTNSIGILTSDNRDNWSDSYQILNQNKINAQSIDEIQKSLFLMCLDSSYDEQSNLDLRTRAGLQTVHGGGSHANGANRWFDKTIQFIVNRNGDVGLTYEHSPAEGQPIAVMMDYIVNYLDNNMEKIDTSTTRNFTPIYKPLPFHVTEELQNRIQIAQQNLDNLVNDLDLIAFKYASYGKEFIKSKKLSPDSYIQMALQLAFYRLHSVPGAQYESGSTRKFLHGRTDTIRSCSVESILFAKRMLNPSATKEEKIQALHEAVSAHKSYAMQTLNGHGIDRHLLGLKLAANELGVEVPKLFSDVGFLRSSHMRVSTSQVASKCDGFMCYGVLVDDGYSCCYNPRPEDINFATAAMRSCEETSSSSFKESLECSLGEMKQLLDSS